MFLDFPLFPEFPGLSSHVLLTDSILMIETYFEVGFLFFVSSERRDVCTTIPKLLKPLYNITIDDTTTTSQDLSQVSEFFSPVSDISDIDNKDKTVFPATTVSPVCFPGIPESVNENLIAEQLLDQQMRHDNDESIGIAQLDITETDLLDFLFAKNDSPESLTGKSVELRVELIERFTKLYGNISPLVIIEKFKRDSVVMKRNKKGLRRIARRNYARLNEGDCCVSSSDEASSVTTKQQCSKKKKNNPCPVCSLDFDTPKELRDHRIVCKDRHHRRKNKTLGTPVDSNRYSCSYCSFSYRDRMILANHKQYHVLPEGEIHFCCVCGMTFRKREMAQRHRKMHINKKI